MLSADFLFARDIMKIEFSPPDKNAPGFLKRLKKVAAFQASFSEGKITGETMDNLVDFLADYVIEPVDREQAKEALWDASETQFLSLLSSVSGGGGNNETKDPPLSGPSSVG
jgi:hypothetical protein